MTTLDQVHLLEEKVEGAVAKIQQLQAENDALRKRCAELTNAYSSQSEQLSSFSSDKNEIEDGIKKALDRLSVIEHTAIKAGTSQKSNGQAASSTPIKATVKPSTPVAPVEEKVAPTPKPVVEKKAAPASIQITPGVSKINEEELHKVQQFNSVNRTPVSSQPIIETKPVSPVSPTPTFNANPQGMQQRQQPSSFNNYQSDMSQTAISFDTMELSSQFEEDEIEDDNYDMDSSESFDDMGLSSSFDMIDEVPSQFNKPQNPQNISEDPNKDNHIIY